MEPDIPMFSWPMHSHIPLIWWGQEILETLCVKIARWKKNIRTTSFEKLINIELEISVEDCEIMIKEICGRIPLSIASPEESSSRPPNLRCPEDEAAIGKNGWKEKPLIVSVREPAQVRTQKRKWTTLRPIIWNWSIVGTSVPDAAWKLDTHCPFCKL